MRMTRLFNQTLRESPAEAQIESHQLLLRAGFIRPVATGIYSYLPLALRSLGKIENIVRQEIDAIGGQELALPVVQPADLWKESGRYYEIDSELSRLQDRNEREMVLGMTHEEVIADLTRREIHSYKQLPLLIYQIQTKWRDDPRPRGGLIRVREFTMKDSYSLDADWNGLEKQYRSHYQAYFRIFERCNLDVLAVKSDTGMMGGKLAHEFMYLTPVGEDTILICGNCDYAANRQIATFHKPMPATGVARPLVKVATPGCKTIESVAAYLDLPTSQTAKAVFMMASFSNGEKTYEKLVFAVVRGDMDVNETKLKNAVKCISLRPATEAEILAVGAEPGYASPIGLTNVLVVVDDLVSETPNLVSGANESDYHFMNVNYGRDFEAQIITDIVLAREKDPCPICQHHLTTQRAVEVGNIFQLGTRFSDSMGCFFLNEDGKQSPVIMGSYGIGIGRLLACIAQEYHDEDGLIWPISIAPYHVHLVALYGKDNAEVIGNSERVYTELVSHGVEVLFDDRQESPGVKFTDADLIGIPIRLAVSNRSLKAGGVEIKLRDQVDKTIIPVDILAFTVKQQITSLYSEIENSIAEHLYPEN